MSLRGVDKQHRRTVCEVLREINDCTISLQRDPYWDKVPDPTQGNIISHCAEMRARLAEAESMCKRMSRKLYEYNKEWDAEFWEENRDWEEDLKRRLGYETSDTDFRV